jgi:hypothetical protein
MSDFPSRLSNADLVAPIGDAHYIGESFFGVSPMTPEMVFVSVVTLASAVLFATEKLRVDLVALIIMGVLLVSGTITPGEGLLVWTDTLTHRRGYLVSTLNFAINDTFRLHKIEIPFPQRDVRLKEGKG